MKSFERCCGLLAIGGLIGLISAVTYTSLMEKAAKDLDAETNFFTDTRAAGCALSLASRPLSRLPAPTVCPLVIDVRTSIRQAPRRAAARCP